jgi:hypothetical protein
MNIWFACTIREFIIYQFNIYEQVIVYYSDFISRNFKKRILKIWNFEKMSKIEMQKSYYKPPLKSCTFLLFVSYYCKMINVGLADFNKTDQTFIQKFENCLPSNEQNIINCKKQYHLGKESLNNFFLTGFYKNSFDIQCFLFCINKPPTFQLKSQSA